MDPGIYSKETKAYVHRKTGSQIFTAGLLKQPRKPETTQRSADRWMQWQAVAGLPTQRNVPLQGQGATTGQSSNLGGSATWLHSERPLTKKVQTTRRVINVDQRWLVITWCWRCRKDRAQRITKRQQEAGEVGWLHIHQSHQWTLYTATYCRSIIPQ